MSKAVALAAVLSPAITSMSLAQRRAAAETGSLARRASVPAPKQQPTPTMTGPTWSLVGGVASGDNPFDMGFALGGGGKWSRSDWPVAIRGDAYFAHHSGDVGGAGFGGFDISVNIFGVLGAAEYTFPTEAKLKPYVFGGLGLFYSNYSFDYDGVFDEDAYDSSTDLGFGVGGGINFTPRFGVELRFMDIDGFTTIPILGVFHF